MAFNFNGTEYNTEYDRIPTVALRGIVIFPGITTSFELGRGISIAAAKTAYEQGSPVCLVTQKDIDVEDPKSKDLIQIGVIAKITNVLRLTNGNYQVMAEGVIRCTRTSTDLEDGFLVSCVQACEDQEMQDAKQEKALNTLWRIFEDYLKYIPKPSEEIVDELHKVKDIGLLTDFIASNFINNFNERKELLEELNPLARARKLSEFIGKDIAYLELENTIQNKVKYNLQKRQREAFLHEQMNVIKDELGMAEDTETGEDDYSKKIQEANLPDAVREKLMTEAGKMAKMPFGMAEATVIQNYLDACLELPWLVSTDDSIDLQKAQTILDEDHDGIKKVKDRVLEFLAVHLLKQHVSGQILCLVGPPGVGKTSVAKSIARATNRKFARVSLGGVHDEAEIRGHRKTYIGAMPGRIIDAIKQSGSNNPVILLDEIDKLANDIHGDPASALLEVLDSEQNVSFRDNFIELPFDLSNVMFIATANTLDPIAPALLDRLEVIEMSSYTDTEKLQIAKNHLVSKQIERNGLTKKQIRFKDEALQLVITGYTLENGVRNLEREIATICRKAAKDIVSGTKKTVVVTPAVVHTYLGPVKRLSNHISETDEIGTVNGLAWTSLGGEMLKIEASAMEGTGKLELTGNLGDVMKESARTAVSYIRKHSSELGIDPNFYAKQDVHIHVPEGAVPKDGPSAGVTLCTALVSELTQVPVKRNVAMTGEITLTGKVLPIGGLREKTMAAYKYGCDTVIIPFDNQSDIEEMDSEVRDHLKLVPVKTISEVLNIAVGR